MTSRSPHRYSRRNDSQGRGWQSVRTIMEGLILAGILWQANSAMEQAKLTAAMGSDLKNIRQQLQVVPSLSRDLASMHTEVSDHERRITRLEDQVENLQRNRQ